MIDREQVRKVANLARLALTEAEEEQFTTQLAGILDYFQQLNELDTADVPPTTRAIEISNVIRPDHHQPYPDRDALLAGAPEQDGNYFRVPKILNPDS